MADNVTIPNDITNLFVRDIQTVCHSIEESDGEIPDESVERLQNLGYL